MTKKASTLLLTLSLWLFTAIQIDTGFILFQQLVTLMIAVKEMCKFLTSRQFLTAHPP